MPAPEAMEALIRVGTCGLDDTDVNTRTVTEATTGETRGGLDADWGGLRIRFLRIQGAQMVSYAIHGDVPISVEIRGAGVAG